MITLLVAFIIPAAHAQLRFGGPQTIPTQTSQQPDIEQSGERFQSEEELRKGTALTRKGAFSDAIPHLLTARGHVANEYAASFNLALCYLGTRQFKNAIEILGDLRRGRHANADVENLLAQSYIGGGQPELGLQALERAASLTPTNEKLYLFVGDACMDRHDYALGLKVAEIGLKALPDSARLHYQKALFLTLLDRFDEARKDFDLAQRQAPGSEISYLAAANESLYAGDPQSAAQMAREAIGKGFEHPTLLKILGEALIRSGVRPSEPGFAEARKVLQLAEAKDSRDAGTQISLAKLCMMVNQWTEAIAHLEKATALEPENPAAYTHLAKAYRKAGRVTDAEAALAILARLNQAQAAKISAAPGDRRRPAYGVPAQQAPDKQ